ARAHAREVRAHAASGQHALTALLPLLDDVRTAVTGEGAARDQLLATARVSAVASAAQVPVADGVRATYYTLSTDADGWRVLGDPRTRGRGGDLVGQVSEKDEPEHPVWDALDSRDSDSSVYSDPERGPGLDWSALPFGTVVTVPVRDGSTVFGVLVVDAPRPGSLTETDRLAVVAAARAMSVLLSLTGPAPTPSPRPTASTSAARSTTRATTARATTTRGAAKKPTAETTS
ncbi:GAF domain-containing protein, partial [Cellulomonas bogoriensis]|uniref:GAF domain-containing protein n=1 Tax=Cellulomonas bogoriensis TaxID=301388 RepID=UPI0018DCB484